ncbi:MAG: hypothetical protein R6X34_26825, partial [Chloroflexota bacterium]
IRTITKIVGTGIDFPLDKLGGTLAEQNSSLRREAMLSTLNGVIGDHLAAQDNPLALPMQLRQNGQSVDTQTLSEAVQQADGKVALLVHGVCMNDLQWLRQGHDHGAALSRDLGLLPIYLHYNSGLHISENGRQLADLLEKTIGQLGQPLELVIIGYSMGGLVVRSACHYGRISGHGWLEHLQKLVFLGTPHHGAPLEKGGNWIDVILEINPYSAPFARLGKIRSSGVTDLRYGNVVDDDWNGHDRFRVKGDQRAPVPLPEGVACYAIAATTNKEFNLLGEDVIGDGLVKVSSALGQHKNAELALSFPESRQWVGRDLNHIALLNHPDVYERMKTWLAE